MPIRSQRHVREVRGTGVQFAPSATLDMRFTTGNLYKGAQLSQLSVLRANPPISYARNGAGILLPFAPNTARQTDLGLLNEDQRANNALQAQTFDNASWVKVAGATAPDVVNAPDGTLTADRFADNNTSSIHELQAATATFTTGTTYTFSCHAKLDTATVIQIAPTAVGFTTNPFANFNLATGAVGTTGGTITNASIEKLKDGWYRCWLTAAADASTGAVPAMLLALTNNNPANIRRPTYVGPVGGNGLYLWGAQVEPGNFPSTYVPTTTIAVTRSFDIATLSGTNFSSWFTGGAAAGTLFWQGLVLGSTGNNQFLVCINDGTSAEEIALYWSASGVMTGRGSDNNVDQFSIGTGILPINTRVKAAVAWAANDAELVVNGVSKGTDNLVALGTYNRMHIGMRGDQSFKSFCLTERIFYAPVRYSQAQLIQSTTL